MVASVIGALRVTLGIDTAAFEEGLGIAQKRLAAAGKNLTSIGDSMKGLGGTLSVALTAPLAAFAATSVSAANESAAAIGQVNAALAPALLWGAFLFGPRVLMCVAGAVLGALGGEWLGCRLQKRRSTLADGYISAINDTAQRHGGLIGQSTREFVAAMVAARLRSLGR